MSDQRNEIEIAGKSVELDAEWEESSATRSLVRVLEKSALEHPWVIAITAITFTAYQAPSQLVSGLAVVAIAAVSIFSVWKRSNREQQEQNKSRSKRENQGSLVRPPG